MPPRRTGQSERGDARREALLSAVVELVERRSLLDLTIAEISARAGVSRSVFYFYFPTKGAAVAALLSDFTDDFIADTHTWFADRIGDPRERILDGTSYALDLWRSRARFFVALLDAGHTDPEAAEAWAEFRRRMEDAIAPMIEDERRLGRARPGPPAPPYVRLLLGLNWSAFEAEVRRIAGGAEPDPGLAERITEIWMRSLY